MARTLSQQLLLNDTRFTQFLSELYTQNLKDICERYSALTEDLTGDILFFSSPGRAELVGNHTDHNHGLVIAGSINLDIAAAVVKRNDNLIIVKSAGYDAFTVDVNDLSVDTNMYGTSLSLLKGVVKGFIDKGFNVGGFDVRADSNIFKGAGVSSSAAFELLFCEILNVLYNDGKIDFTTKAIIGRFAENVYFGKPSGLMDQLSISRGNVSFMDFSTEIPNSFTAEWNFDDLSLVIINCGGDHCNLTGEYASIRSEMESIAKYFGKSVLNEVAPEKIYDSLPILRQKFPGRALLRALHFIEENERVKKAYDAINRSDKDSFLSIINESGLSSALLLQNCYPSGDYEQTVPSALAVVKRDDRTLACRVHGGGFAGTILAFVDTQNETNYLEKMRNVFGNENVFGVKIRKFGAVCIYNKGNL